MSMADIRKTHGVPAKRGMRVRFKSGAWAGRTGVIRRAHSSGWLVVTDKPGRYVWYTTVHPMGLEYLTEVGS